MSLQWLACLAPGITGSVLGLVSPVSVYCDWVRLQVWFAASISVQQHVWFAASISVQQHVWFAASISVQQHVWFAASISVQQHVWSAASISVQQHVWSAASISVQQHVWSAASISVQQYVWSAASISVQQHVWFAASISVQQHVWFAASISVQQHVWFAASILVQQHVWSAASISVQQHVWSAASISVQQHVHLSQQIRPWDTQRSLLGRWAIQQQQHHPQHHTLVVCIHNMTHKRPNPSFSYITYTYIKGSRPQWCISRMMYSRDTPFWSISTIHHAWDAPFWSGTLVTVTQVHNLFARLFDCLFFWCCTTEVCEGLGRKQNQHFFNETVWFRKKKDENNISNILIMNSSKTIHLIFPYFFPSVWYFVLFGIFWAPHNNKTL